jgi:hypothetical protein
MFLFIRCQIYEFSHLGKLQLRRPFVRSLGIMLDPDGVFFLELVSMAAGFCTTSHLLGIQGFRDISLKHTRSVVQKLDNHRGKLGGELIFFRCRC